MARHLLWRDDRWLFVVDDVVVVVVGGGACCCLPLLIMIIMLKYTKICTLLLIEPVALSVKSIGGGACFILKHYWKDFAFLFSMWMGFSISERNLKGEATVIVYSLIKQHSHYSIIVRVVILLN